MTTLEFADSIDGDHVLCRFCSAWHIGFVLLDHWEVLVEAAGDGVYELPRTIDRRLDGACQGAQVSASAYTMQAREDLRTMFERGDNHAGKQFCAAIPDHDAGVISRRLTDLQASGLSIAKRTAAQWAATTEIQAHFEEQTAVPLRVRKHSRACKLQFQRKERLLLLEIGEPETPIEHFLALEFEFFHEYLSHVLPRNDDADRLFSEGFLFELEVRAYNTPAGNPALSVHVERYLRRREMAAEFELARHAARHYFGVCADRFAARLFEMMLWPVTREEFTVFIGRLRSVVQRSDTRQVCELINDPRRPIEALASHLARGADAARRRIRES